MIVSIWLQVRALKGVGAFSEEEDRLLAQYVECHGGKGLKGCINWGGVVDALKGKRNTMECQNRHHTLRRLNGKVEKVEVELEDLVLDSDTAATTTTTTALAVSSSSSGPRTRTRIEVSDMMSHVSPLEQGPESHLCDRAAVVACEEPEPEPDQELSAIPILTNDSAYTDEKVVKEVEIGHPRMDHIIYPSDTDESTLPLSTVSSNFDIRNPSAEVVEEVEIKLSHVQETNHRETDLLV